MAVKIIRHRLDGDVDMVQRSIERIRFFEANALDMNENGYYVAYSGGKDSAVIAELCKMAGVKFELVNNHTTVDPQNWFIMYGQSLSGIGQWVFRVQHHGQKKQCGN